ncbi:hypothetical protein P4V47_24780 [Brevibacillus laterosporus]|uniref:DUF3967 domain-containing protein n=1 Tax=Brevibacillus laterosporus TaxID=1465 RepID=UPI002E1A1311|nr:hypothetical protein [Brevibacillus laterosporus]
MEDQQKLLAAQIGYMQQMHEELNAKLIHRLEEHGRYIEERLKSEDELIQTLVNEIHETTRLLASTQELPPKKWYQFWK